MGLPALTRRYHLRVISLLNDLGAAIARHAGYNVSKPEGKLGPTAEWAFTVFTERDLGEGKNLTVKASFTTIENRIPSEVIFAIAVLSDTGENLGGIEPKPNTPLRISNHMAIDRRLEAFFSENPKNLATLVQTHVAFEKKDFKRLEELQHGQQKLNRVDGGDVEPRPGVQPNK